MAKPSRPRPLRPMSEACGNDISPSDVNSVVETKYVPVLGNQATEYLDSSRPMPLVYVNSTNSDNPTRSGSEENDPSCVVKQATANQSETITKVLLAQAETTRRLLEANRTQQEILESRMNQIVGQLEQVVPVSNRGIIKKLDAKLDSVLHKLDQIITHTNVQSSEQMLHRKIEVVLERLEHILPYTELYNSSAPNLVDKIDSLLTGMDKVVPYACNFIEVNTEEEFSMTK